MSTQEKMFCEVENWMSSGETKSRFLEGKTYSSAKFNYWVAKWKSNEQIVDGSSDAFREVSFSDAKLRKVLEIESPSGVKITVFA